MTWQQFGAGMRSYPLALRGWWHGWRVDRTRAAVARHETALRGVIDTAERLRGVLES